jgi:hypothetical protein
MAVLINFPINCNDQISVIEIFDGLMRQRDDARSMEPAPGEAMRSLPDLPHAESQRGSSDPSE